MQNESIIRTILRNEITWAIVIVAGIWGFVQTVILPLNTVQTTLAQIQKDIAEFKNNNAALTGRVDQQGDDIIRLDQRLQTLENKMR